MVYTVDALVIVGVPEILPLPVFRVRPVGKLGLIEYTNVPSPPLAVTGVNALIATFCTATLFETACTVSNAPGTTSMLKLLLVV
jgi:hypothetical protein